MSPPFFYFIPDKNGDDVPDAEPQLLLDGFGNFANSHNIANGFAWDQMVAMVHTVVPTGRSRQTGRSQGAKNPT